MCDEIREQLPDPVSDGSIVAGIGYVGGETDEMELIKARAVELLHLQPGLLEYIQALWVGEPPHHGYEWMAPALNSACVEYRQQSCMRVHRHTECGQRCKGSIPQFVIVRVDHLPERLHHIIPPEANP